LRYSACSAVLSGALQCECVELLKRIITMNAFPGHDKAAHSPERCPACGGAGTYLLSATDRNRKTTRELFLYHSCSVCGLIYMQPQPLDMSSHYKGGYDPIPRDLEALREIAAREHFRCNPILRHRPGGKFLELGPWRGVLCCQMKDAGFSVTAIEMDQSCVNFLRNTVGVEAIRSEDPVQTMRGMQPGFDAIGAWHSLEHLPTPWLVIQEAARLLNPGGVLLLAMPNPESFEFRLMRSRWMHLDAPRHLYLFPIRSLVEVCGRHGLDLLEVTTADIFSDIQSRHAWHMLARSYIPVKYVRGVAGSILYWLARHRQRQEGRGSAYCAVFRRR
jgi:SAM-dependent methyltransferase